MRISSFLCVLTAALAQALPTKIGSKAELPAYFILTGDSTTASGGGWGDGFLSYARNSASGINHAKNGATTVSFKSDGYWAKAIQSIKDKKASYRPIVTIQFGHNDQKAEKGISVAQFTTNLKTMANEVISAGGTPIIVTSLSRRTFSNGKVVENLAEHSAAAISAANSLGIKYLPLNRASTDYLNAIGQTNADKYNMEEGDRTHLNSAGKIVFGRMVADLLDVARADLKTYLKDNKALSDKIAKGEFATGSE
ncbi:unnamed protein product [Clonostachys rhizophaga]|uniref:SGNH hydrolase-type esterase domain-containing protein n=1 Tax=Clonostachys rhizophaga TaxID=160324 RepID=A0A9N9V6Y0_9HYPO|nr:unnamed protein product [Clonostachys rhizophaga]